MKNLFIIALAAITVMTGCGKYDDSAINKRVADLEQRITTLQGAVTALDTKVQSGSLIKSVTALPGASGGWRIEFTSGTPSSIEITGGEEGPIKSVSENPDGTVTITMNGAGGASYTFEKASSAVRFEIMTPDTDASSGTTNFAVRFVVNPSTAWIPTSADGGLDKWFVNAVSKRSTRAPGYVVPSTDFTLTDISPSATGAGEYVATLRRASGSSISSTDYTLALVLNTASASAPVLVSSSAFTIGPPPSTSTVVVTPDPYIQIITQPVGVRPSGRDDANLSIAAIVVNGSSSSNLTYTWYRASNQAVLGTGASVSIPYSAVQGGQYITSSYSVYCVVSGSGMASVQSNTVSVTYQTN